MCIRDRCLGVRVPAAQGVRGRIRSGSDVLRISGPLPNHYGVRSIHQPVAGYPFSLPLLMTLHESLRNGFRSCCLWRILQFGAFAALPIVLFSSRWKLLQLSNLTSTPLRHGSQHHHPVDFRFASLWKVANCLRRPDSSKVGCYPDHLHTPET